MMMQMFTFAIFIESIENSLILTSFSGFCPSFWMWEWSLVDFAIALLTMVMMGRDSTELSSII